MYTNTSVSKHPPPTNVFWFWGLLYEQFTYGNQPRRYLVLEGNQGYDHLRRAQPGAAGMALIIHDDCNVFNDITAGVGDVYEYKDKITGELKGLLSIQRMGKKPDGSYHWPWEDMKKEESRDPKKVGNPLGPSGSLGKQPATGAPG